MPSSEAIPVEVDPARIEVTAAGVADYYWPVRQQEVMQVAARVVDTIVETLRQPVAAGDHDARLVNMVGSVLFGDLLGFAIARLLATRFARDGRVPLLAHTRMTEWRASFLGEPAGISRLEAILARGVARPPTWRRLLRPLGDLRSNDVFIRRPIELANFAGDTIAVTICPLTRAHARKTAQKLVYVPLYEWFGPPTDIELRARPPQPIRREFRDHIVERLEATIREAGAGPAGGQSNFLPELLDGATKWVNFYLTRVEARPNRLPRRLWKGSSGVIWSRILADAVQAHGGHVTGHDHAYGANYSERTLIPFNELQANDVFVTFSKAQADLYRRRSTALRIGSTLPEIIHLGPDAPGELTPLPPVPDRPPRKLLYVTPFLSGSRIGAMPLMPAVMAYDWQARLFAMLTGQGLQVTQKPHPETEFPPAAFFEKGLGIHTRHERFEAIMQDFDVVLFDFAPQSCFGSVLRSDRPVVLIDFGVTEYPPDLRALLERRCAIVPGSFDADNRAQVDPAALAAAIQRARHLRDPGFAAAISL